MNRFNKRIKILRRQKNLSHRYLAHFLDTDPVQLAAIEEGKRHASKDQVLKLASCLETDEKELLMDYLGDQISKNRDTQKSSPRIDELRCELNSMRNRRIQFRMHKPPPPLNRYIRAFIYYKGYNGPDSYERSLPDGNTEIVFNLNSSEKRTNPELNIPKIWVTGAHKHHSTVKLAQEVTNFTVQFSPGGFYALTGKSPAEIKHHHTDAGLIFGRDIYILRERLMESLHNIKNLFQLTADFFQVRAHEPQREYAFIGFMTENINTPLQQLVMKTGYSRKHIIHLFKKFTGVSPKYYQRICRFNNSLNDILSAHSSVNWLDVAFKNGFYDQSHFIREFSYFSGFSPKSYLDTGATCSRLVHLSADTVQVNTAVARPLITTGNGVTVNR